MTIFAAEFPVNKNANKASFTALVIAWIRGIRRSKLLSLEHELERYDDEVTTVGEQGELLVLKNT